MFLAPRKILPHVEAAHSISGFHCVMFLAGAFSCASPWTALEIFTIPHMVRSLTTCPRIVSLSSSHVDKGTVPRHDALLLISRSACRHGPPGFAKHNSRPGRRAHHTKITAKVRPLECLLVFLNPVPVLDGVLTLERFLHQVVGPSLRGAQPHEVAKSPACRVLCRMGVFSPGCVATKVPVANHPPFIWWAKLF